MKTGKFKTKLVPANIAKGVANYLYINPKVELIHKDRIAICNDCEYRSNTKPHFCTVCKCILDVKTRAPKASCPKDKWAAIENIDVYGQGS